MFRWILSALIGALLAMPAVAQNVERAPAPAWVQPIIPPTGGATSDAAPVRYIAWDRQIRFDDTGTHTHYYLRTKIQTREGLSYVSPVNAEWDPSREMITVNSVRIIRGEQIIDVLDQQSFETIRRENNLESSMLDGVLTATLQPRDLRVGDILETSFTVHDTGGVLSPHRESWTMPNSDSVIDRYRLRASWPVSQAIRAAAIAPWAEVHPRRSGQDWVFEVQEDDIQPERTPEDLPGRFAWTRLAQFTDFENWAALSTRMTPHYDKSSQLEDTSPIKAEIERIRSTYSTQDQQAAAALRLVQDEIRYVALSMGEGGYVPATADEVWRSRYGDCKGKTVLLLALLKGLGIEAEAALVSTTSGDGLPERLPMVGWFDHVIVRAEIDGVTHWLDGTRMGDRSLESIMAPDYKWALPVRVAEARLLPIEQPPLRTPRYEATLDFDVTGGLDSDVPIVADMAFFGDAGAVMQERVSNIPADQLQTMMLAMWNKDDAITQFDRVETRYDADANVFHLIAHGRGRMAWISGTAGRVAPIDATELSIPYKEERKGLLAAFNDAPYAISHPVMNRLIFRVRLPDNGDGFRLEGGDQTVEGGGYRMERQATLQDGVAQVIVTTTSLTPEVSAQDMANARRRARALTSSNIRLRAPTSYGTVAAERTEAGTDPGEAESQIRRAAYLAQAGDFPAATTLMDGLITREPENIRAIKLRAAIKVLARDYEGARADYDLAVDVDPADAGGAFGQADVAAIQGRYNDAVVNYSVGLRLEPDNLSALLARANAYHQLGRWDRSLTDYRTAKTFEGGVERSLGGEVRELIRLRRIDEARTLVDARLATNANDPVALGSLAIVTKAQGKPSEALPALDAAIIEAPESAGFLTLRAEVRVSSGDVAGARTDYALLRQMAAGDPELMNNLCWSQATSGIDLDQALIDCELALAAGEAAFIDSHAMVLLQLDRFEEAKAAYDLALAGYPDLPASLYGRGMARLAMGDAAGREDVERARSFDIDAADDFEAFEKRRPDLVQ